MDLNKIQEISDQDYIRSNRYEINMPAPEGMGKVNAQVLEIINKNCSGVNLPGTDFKTFEWQSKAPEMTLPYARQYNDISMTFYVDGGGVVRQFFENWMSLIHDPTNYNFNYLDKYSVEMTITPIRSVGSGGQNIQVYTVKTVYPIKISDIDMAYDSSGIATMTVDMTYDVYTLNPGNVTN